MAERVILVVDEGTTGTRAALLTADGRIEGLTYRRISVQSPEPGMVIQDANEILTATTEVVRSAVAHAAAHDMEIVSVGISTQRATVTLWDAVTGQPLAPSCVWQDTRHAAELAERFSSEWDDRLVGVTGRRVGVRVPYFWAAQQIRNNPEVAAAHAAGRLRFGSIDTWLLWHLTEERTYVTTATNVTATGGLRLQDFTYHDEWIQAVGFPAELLPELADDGAFHGTTRADILGIRVPVTAVIGDQHGAIIGLGCIDAGSAMVVHGTGSFVDLVNGPDFPSDPSRYEATLTLTGWRTKGRSVYSVETFTATTGSALDWFCNELGWFESAKQISELAGQVEDSAGVLFIPALTGIRSPVLTTKVRASLSGITTATTKAQVAHGMLEGVAHFVAQSIEANAETAGRQADQFRVGGGMSASDTLLQLQADLVGLPMQRQEGANDASLRGAGFLAGCDGLIWESLSEAVATLRPGRTFEPQIGDEERLARRAGWRQRIDEEVRRTAN
jgi:glycerol kinase